MPTYAFMYHVYLSKSQQNKKPDRLNVADHTQKHGKVGEKLQITYNIFPYIEIHNCMYFIVIFIQL